MRWLIFSLVLLPVISLTNPAISQEKTHHICFFELNNQTSSENFKKDLKSKDLSKGTKVHIFTPQFELKSQDSNAEVMKGFKAMIEKTSKDGNKCDSLVISGHHTGDWYGQYGGLRLKDLEDLSCDPKYKDWFSNINALWLDGCNTVTDNVLKGSPNIPTPDLEATRVSEKETSGTYVSEFKIRELSQAYTASLDKNTPLSSRYLRAFPNTQIYGFNGVAPEGHQSGNFSFIAKHLSNIGTALKAQKKFLGHNETVKKIKLGLTALTDELCDQDRIKAWETTGDSLKLKTEAIEQLNYKMAEKLGCDLILAKQVLKDPSSKSSREALAKTIKNGSYPNNLLKLANAILSNSLDEKQKSKKALKLAKELVNHTLTEIIEKDQELGSDDSKLSLTHLLFHNIYETWTTAKKYQNKDNSFFKSVKNKLRSNKFKNSLLQDRIKSNQTSSIRKADYIKFYIEVNNKKDDEGIIDKAIEDLIEKSINNFPNLKSLRANDTISERSRRALALSVADQLLQYDLLTNNQKIQLLNSYELFPNKTDDTLHQSVEVKLRISLSEERVLDHLKNNKGGIGFRSEAIKVFTEKYLQIENESQAVSSFQNFMNEVVNKNKQRQHIVWNEMHYQLQYKTPKERVSIMSSLINSEVKGADYTRAFVSNYGQYLPENEKKELCNKIKQNYTWYKTEIINCP